LAICDRRFEIIATSSAGFMLAALATLLACGSPNLTGRQQGLFGSGTACLILPGSWASATASFRVLDGTDAGRLELADLATGDDWHQRAAVHPSGRTVYVNTSVRYRGVFVSAFRFDPESCGFGARISHLAPSRDSTELHRYYGLEVHPNGRFLYQTTEAVRELRFYRIADDGTLTLGGRYDVTAGGEHICHHIRRLELHADRGVLYANCNNQRAEPPAPAAVQVWSIAVDGSLALLEHHSLDDFDGGVFDPVLHPSGEWLYQPVGTMAATAPDGTGWYLVQFAVASDGRLRRVAATRVDDPDVNGAGPDPAGGAAVSLTTFLIDPSGNYGFATVSDAQNGTHFVATLAIDSMTGRLEHRSDASLFTVAKNASHHGGVLAPGPAGEDLYLYTYITSYAEEGGVLEQFRVDADGSLHHLEPPVVLTGLPDARHPVVVPRP
jgi:6-phosphogluconolactonase (cycloisomerase 2 family)